VGDYAYKPLVAYDENGNEVSAVIRHQLYAHLGASLVLWERLRIGFDLPFLLISRAPPATTGSLVRELNAQAVGDLRLGLDIRLFGAWRGPRLSGSARRCTCRLEARKISRATVKSGSIPA
jgi:hypothetical protein